MNSAIWLVGAGEMSLEYVRVLQGLEVPFLVIGRGGKSAQNLEMATGCVVECGGLNRFLGKQMPLPPAAIVSVGVEQLAQTTQDLLNYGVKRILLEKPGGIGREEIEQVAILSREMEAEVYLAYNRRFYNSVLKANEIIEEDGGVSSFFFEFTEWSHRLQDLEKLPEIKEQWFLSNSTHVVDLAFFLGGEPSEMHCFTAGGLAWHPSASNFCGSGVSHTGSLFAYMANWKAPGRWGVEILTTKHRLIFRPLEELHLQKIGSLATEKVELEDTLDQTYKPGLFRQTEAFLTGKGERLCRLEHHVARMEIYSKIAGKAL